MLIFRLTSFVDNTIDLPWRNFLSAFEAKFQREVLLFLEISEFPYNTVVEKKLKCQKLA